MMRLLIIICIILTCNTFEYTYDDDYQVYNAGRGWYKHTETKTSAYTSLQLSTLNEWLSNGITTVFRQFVLDTFVTTNITNTMLNMISEDFTRIRSANMKIIVRFCYTLTNPGSSPYGDATPTMVQNHIQQLAPILNQHAPVIAALQAGFIGVWGEWYYTTYFGSPNTVFTAQNWQDRRDVVTSLLASVPSYVQVQLRTPNYKRKVFENSNDEVSVRRVGFHNDCFLASDSDFGTFADPVVDKAYMSNETEFAIMGGETCNPNSPRSDCTTALVELRQMHYTFLNSAYHPTVLSSWSSGGCNDTVGLLLGARIALVRSVNDNGAELLVGRDNGMSVHVKNHGFAPLYVPYKVSVQLRSSQQAVLLTSNVNIDVREEWVPASGTHVSVFSLTIPPTLTHRGSCSVWMSIEEEHASGYFLEPANPNAQFSNGYFILFDDLLLASHGSHNGVWSPLVLGVTLAIVSSILAQ